MWQVGSDRKCAEGDGAYLEAHELLKVKLQDGCPTDVREAADMAAEQLKAEFVQAIGRKFSLYRQSRKDGSSCPERRTAFGIPKEKIRKAQAFRGLGAENHEKDGYG